MAFVSLALALASGLSAIVVIAFLWFLDVFERESWKNLALAIVIGSGSYALVLSLFASLVDSLFPAKAEISPATAFWALSISTALLILGEIAAICAFYRLKKRSFETMTDYVLYSCSIGAGFDCAERITTQLLNSFGLQPLSNQVYFSSFGFGNYYPFLFALYGSALFLWINSSRVQSICPRKTALSLTAVGIGTQIAFSLATLLPNISFRDSYSILNGISEAVFAVTLNISYLSIAGLIGICVLMDSYIIERFTENLESRQEFSRFRDWFHFLRHPWYQLCSSHAILWRYSGVSNDVKLPRSLLNKYSRIALRSWLAPGQEEQLVNSAHSLLLDAAGSSPDPSVVV